MSNILVELNFLKENQISIDPNTLQEYGKDWTRYYTPNPKAILFPNTTEEVQKIVLWANKNNISIVPSGGRTGLSGAAVANNGKLFISSKMNKILEFNELDLTLTCESGCVTEEVQNHVKNYGYHFPVDFAARGSSQIGGNVATNVGGLNVIRYGLMREWVSGLEVVTGSGEILNLNNSLVKNASGYDLRHLIIGSEGTLAIVTKVTLRLTEPPKESSVLILGLDKKEDIGLIFQKFRKNLKMSAFELFTREAMEYVLEHHTELAKPIETDPPYYILIETETDTDSKNQILFNTFEECMNQGWIVDGVISQNIEQAQQFWKYRDYISESLSPHTPYKNDISVRISKVTEFIQKTDEVLKKEYPTFKVVWFGHIGDGNLHINILKPKTLDMNEFVKSCQNVDKILFGIIQNFSGSISAEHGVGLSKKPFLHYTRSKEEIQIMKKIKNAFDPKNILNPGKIFDL